MRLFAYCSMLLLLACGDALPCSTCPDIAGRYAVSWADGGTTEDGGTCGAGAPRLATWTFTQRGSNVGTDIEDVALSGTLYDTYDLALAGSATGVSYRLRTLVIPSGTSVDAGIRLQGTFTTRTLPEDGGACEVIDSFTAQRTGR